MLDLLRNRIAVTQLVAFLLAAIASFGIALPASFSSTSVVAAIMLVAAAVTAALRFGHPGEPAADAKVWFRSRTILTQIVAAGFAVLTLFGILPDVDQVSVVETMMGFTVASIACGGTVTKPIA